MEAIAEYTVLVVSDLYVLIADCKSPCKPSVTNSASGVIRHLNDALGSLGGRRVYYRDTVNRFDELVHVSGEFKAFAPVRSSQQHFFQALAFG